MSPMRLDAARAAAADWVRSRGRSYPGYLGAYPTAEATPAALPGLRRTAARITAACPDLDRSAD